MKTVLYLIALLGFFSSCTITQGYEFNEDFSGSTYIEIDASAMMALMGNEEGAPDPISEALDSINTDSILDATNAKPGIQNASISNQDGVVRFAYDFDNLESLNLASASEDVAEYLGGSSKKGKSVDRFELKGKKLSYTIPEMESIEDSSMAEMEGMAEMMKYQVKMTFADPVKKVSSDAYTLTSDQKTIILSTTITEFIEGNTGTTDVKF